MSIDGGPIFFACLTLYKPVWHLGDLLAYRSIWPNNWRTPNKREV